jgi:hypothetical protein
MYPGLLGELIDTVGPHTEASPVAIAAQFFVAFGNAAGREPHFYIGETRHGLNENLLVVGQTSRSRKGDSRASALRPLEDADPAWSACIASGLSTGEGLICAVRDPIEKLDKHGEPVLIDKGIADKRLCVVETEFANPLKQFRRETNILSCVIRDAWDAKKVLRTMTKTSPTRATDAHISIIGHATPADLTEYLADVEAANGLGNRFLIVLVDRVRLLPDPGRADRNHVQRLSDRIRERLDHARSVGTLHRTGRAREAWCRIYRDLSSDIPGLVGNMLARSEAHVARLSALFAVLDGAEQIDLQHLTAALAWWDYIEASTRAIFAGRTGNDAADRIRADMVPRQSLTVSQIRDQIFGGHVTAAKLTAAIELLTSMGEITVEKQPTAGRPQVIVTRTGAAEKEEKAEKPPGDDPFSTFSGFSSEGVAS